MSLSTKKSDARCIATSTILIIDVNSKFIQHLFESDCITTLNASFGSLGYFYLRKYYNLNFFVRNTVFEKFFEVSTIKIDFKSCINYFSGDDAQKISLTTYGNLKKSWKSKLPEKNSLRNVVQMPVAPHHFFSHLQKLSLTSSAYGVMTPFLSEQH